MSQLTLHLLGAPGIARDGAPVAVDTRKATALLAYLAVTGRSHAREALAALLWPEYDDEHARGRPCAGRSPRCARPWARHI